MLGLLKKPNALWVRCLKGKYYCGEDSFPSVMKKGKQSEVWKSITTVWEDFKKGLGKIVRNGKSTTMWVDYWSPMEQPLSHYVERNIHLIDKEEKVNSFVLPSGQ